MESDITKTKLYDGLTLIQERELIQRWDALRKSQREMFLHVVSAVKKREGLANAGNMQFEDWASRYDVAAEYGKLRLIGSRIKLLEGLIKDGFLVTVERRNGHIDQHGRYRPHNSSWVYKPAPGVLEALAYAAEIRLGAKLAAEKPVPKKRVPSQKPYESWQPPPGPPNYADYGMGRPSRRNEPIILSEPNLIVKVWHFLGRIDPFKRED